MKTEDRRLKTDDGRQEDQSNNKEDQLWLLFPSLIPKGCNYSSPMIVDAKYPGWQNSYRAKKETITGFVELYCSLPQSRRDVIILAPMIVDAKYPGWQDSYRANKETITGFVELYCSLPQSRRDVIILAQ